MSSIRDFFPIEYRVGGTKPKRNFLLENRKYVTKLASSNQALKENENPSNRLCCTNIRNCKLKPVSNKESDSDNSKKLNLDKIDASIKSIRSAIAQTKITQKKLATTNCEKTFIFLKDQATQTVNPCDKEDLLKNSIIRYPNSGSSDIDKIICNNKHRNTASVQTEYPETKYDNSTSRKDFKTIIIKDDNNSKKKQSHSIGLKENMINHHQPGEIPKYLKDRKALKEKNDKETQKKLAIRHELGLDDPACPPGHILLPEPERLEHLSKIKKDYTRLITQLNMLPVSSDSYKMIEKRKNIEKELDKLQLGIKLFSREKLFVNVNRTIENA